MADDWKPPTADDVSDHALLPKLFRMHVAEVKDVFDTFARKLDLILQEFRALTRDHADLERRVKALEPPPYVPKAMRGRK